MKEMTELQVNASNYTLMAQKPCHIEMSRPCAWTHYLVTLGCSNLILWLKKLLINNNKHDQLKTL